jgi:hypothetical protein
MKVASATGAIGTVTLFWNLNLSQVMTLISASLRESPTLYDTDRCATASEEAQNSARSYPDNDAPA